MARKQDSQLEDDSSPWSDGTTRFEVDALLRRHGYRIHRRRKGQKPLWTRGTEICDQRTAEESLPKEELRLARMRQRSYRAST